MTTIKILSTAYFLDCIVVMEHPPNRQQQLPEKCGFIAIRVAWHSDQT